MATVKIEVDAETWLDYVKLDKEYKAACKRVDNESGIAHIKAVRDRQRIQGILPMYASMVADDAVSRFPVEYK
jgi:hypothetical protein